MVKLPERRAKPFELITYIIGQNFEGTHNFSGRKQLLFIIMTKKQEDRKTARHVFQKNRNEYNDGSRLENISWVAKWLALGIIVCMYNLLP